MKKNSLNNPNRKGVAGVLADLRAGFAKGELWRHFAWDEIQNRYRRSALGIAWIGLSFLFFVVVIVLFFRGMSRADPGYFMMYVAIGFAAFNFLIGNVTDGCEVFRTSATWIKSTPLPYSVHIYKSISRSVFTFGIQFSLTLIVITIAGWRPHPGALMAIPALLIFLLNAVWIQLLFGLFATRFRDISHLISTITRLLFFTTPILWTMEQRTGLVRKIALYNPLTHYIEIFRAPIMNITPLEQSWPIVLGLTLIGSVVTVFCASVMLKRLPFWL